MARLTLRIPDSLHALLAECAKREGVSMNQYIVFALSRMTTVDDMKRQRTTAEALLKRFDEKEAEAALRRMLNDRMPLE